MDPQHARYRQIASDLRLQRLCVRAGLAVEQLSGLAPVHEGQTDPYDIVGSGDIEGCEVVRYGRFGNNLQQLAFALQFVRTHGLKWVRAAGLGDLFKPGRHTLHDGIVIHLDDAGPATGAALRGRFFFWWGTGGALRRIGHPQFAEAVRRDLSSVLSIERLPVSDGRPRLHLHLRGGDVFGPEGQVNSAYVQPPLAFYVMAAQSWLGQYPGGELVVVSQDRRNPCVDGLLDWAAVHGCLARFECSGERKDIACLLAATEIVAGFGTFVPMIALLSDTVQRVVYFRARQKAEALESLGILVDVVRDGCGRYLRFGEWRNSPAQRVAMLEYPDGCLTWGLSNAR